MCAPSNEVVDTSCTFQTRYHVYYLHTRAYYLVDALSPIFLSIQTIILYKLYFPSRLTFSINNK